MSGTIDSLNNAKAMAFENSQLYPDFFKTVLPIVYNNDLVLQKWCLNFLIESYTNSEKKLLTDLLKTLSIQILEPTLFLLKVKDVEVVKKSIHLILLTYELIFLNVLENKTPMECKIGWQKMSEIKQEIMRNFQTAFPLIPFNKQTDAMRSIGCKLQTILLIGKISEIQLPSPPRDPRMRRSASGDKSDVSISMIPPNHPVLNDHLGAEGQALLDVLFNSLNDEALVTTPLFGAIELVLIKLLKKRPNHVYNKLTNLVLAYESDLKKRSVFEEDKAKVILIKRFNDRINKILISFLINKKLIKDSTLQQRLSKKYSYVMMRNDALKKRGILNEPEEENDAKRRKVEPMILESDDVFYNSSPISRDYRYASLYSLINPKDSVNQFDLSNIPQEVLANMVLIALKKIERSKLIGGLTIVSERYREILMRPREGGVKVEQPDIGNNYLDDEQEDDEPAVFDEIDDLNGVAYELPIPKAMTPEQKKEHLRRIITNFINMASKDIATGPNFSEKLESNQSDLSKVAIPSWNKESWLVVLTRLASRGLADGTPDETESLSDMIREEIFKYFSDDIRNRIDVSIEWLNEEWYSETIKNEKNAKTALLEGGDADNEKYKETPIYNKWAGKVLDTIILFMESSDRKLFIRLLSDLPYLNKELVWKIKSLCLDPMRFKIGFQSLQFLAIYRPPVKQSSIELLKELQGESKDNDEGNDDFKKEVASLLKKLCPEE